MFENFRCILGFCTVMVEPTPPPQSLPLALHLQVLQLMLVYLFLSPYNAVEETLVHAPAEGKTLTYNPRKMLGVCARPR